MSTLDPNSVRAIAVRDLREVAASGTFWTVSTVCALVLVLVALGISYVGGMTLSIGAYVGITSVITTFVVPLLGLLVGWNAIVTERDTGRIPTMLSMAHSRTDVVVGTFVSRATLLSASLVFGFAVAGVGIAHTLSSFSPVEYVAFLAITTLYALVFLSIAIAIGTITRSSLVAVIAMISLLLAYYVVWHTITFVLGILVWDGHLAGRSYTVDGWEYERLPDWILFLDTLDPGTAYQNALAATTAASPVEIGTYYEPAAFPSGIPLYLQDWVGIPILLCWIVLPLVYARYRFDRVDI